MFLLVLRMYFSIHNALAVNRMVVRHVGYSNSTEYKGYVVVTGNRMRI